MVDGWVAYIQPLKQEFIWAGFCYPSKKCNPPLPPHQMRNSILHSSLHLKQCALNNTCTVAPRCNSVIEYAAYSSVWIMVAQLLHNHWYGINGHTNQGQRVLSGSTHCPSVILALGGRQPQPFRGVASSIKSLWHRGGDAPGVGMHPVSKNNLENIL